MTRARELADLGGSADAGGITGKNLIINGAMQVAQRSTSATGVGASTGYNAQDRWKFFTIGSASARWTQSVSTDVPASSTFTTSLKLDCTTASGTVGSDDRQQLTQTIEAQDLQRLRYGSSGAKKVTLSFWVKSSVTGKNYCMFYHDDSTRFTYKSYTVDSADTWEYKTLTFSGDTASAITNDNGAGLSIIWMLYLGDDYTSATDGAEDTWAAWNSGNYDQFNGQVNNASSTDNNWYLCGVQLEVGSATPFEHEPFSVTKHKCQRYYQRAGNVSGFFINTTGRVRGLLVGETGMRAQPTASNTTGLVLFYKNTSTGVSAITIFSAPTNFRNGPASFIDFDTTATSTVQGQGCAGDNNTDNRYFELDAEL